MKIRRLKIVGYKVIDYLDLDFTDANGKTLDTIIFAGLNGCGKTTILEAIQSVFSIRIHNDNNTILANEISIEFDLTNNIEFQNKFLEMLNYALNKIIFPENLNENTVSQKTFIEKTILSIKKSNTFTVSYASYGKQFRINHFVTFNYLSYLITQLGFNFTFIPSETYMSKLWTYPKDEIKDKGIIKEEIQSRKEEFFRTIDFDEDKTLIKSYIINEFLQSVIMDQDTIPRITMGKIIDKINKIFQHINLNTTLTEIDTKEIKFKSSNGQIITIDGLSSGEKQLFYRFVYLQTLEIQNSIIMVDEPETSLHPTWQQQLSKLYQSVGTNNQVILATHSPHILASVKPENIFLLNVKDSKIEAVHLKDTDLKTKGVETNRILKEIMGVTKLMDEETSADMIALNQFIEADNFDKPEAIEVYNRLLTNLGKEDSYIVSVDFEIVMRKKMREKKLKAVV